MKTFIEYINESLSLMRGRGNNNTGNMDLFGRGLYLTDDINVAKFYGEDITYYNIKGQIFDTTKDFSSIELRKFFRVLDDVLGCTEGMKYLRQIIDYNGGKLSKDTGIDYISISWGLDSIYEFQEVLKKNGLLTNDFNSYANVCTGMNLALQKMGYVGLKYSTTEIEDLDDIGLGGKNAYLIFDKTIKSKLNIFESITNLDYEYKFDNSKLRTFINSARKWNEKDFVEEYVYLNDIETVGVYNNINKGEEILLGREVKDSDGKNVYNVTQVYSPYKKVKADKYYSNVWQFILDNTKELQEEGRILYNLNKGIKKPKFSKNEKTIRGYHASSHKFDEFRYNTGNNSSGQLGADSGFFFFKDIKNAKYYASVLKENNGIGYIYECDIKLGEVLQVKGEDVGTNWGRIGFFEQAKNEGYDVVIIADADTGYGITDEIVVFDDDNINILNIISI